MLTLEEIRALFVALEEREEPPVKRDLLLLQLLTAARPGEVRNATWSQYCSTPGRTGSRTLGFDLATSVDPQPVATSLRLGAPRPNPMTGPSTFSFTIDRAGVVSVEIFDVRGRKVRTLDAMPFEAGAHLVRWDGKDGSGEDVASGGYFGRVLVSGFGGIVERVLNVQVVP